MTRDTRGKICEFALWLQGRRGEATIAGERRELVQAYDALTQLLDFEDICKIQDTLYAQQENEL